MSNFRPIIARFAALGTCGHQIKKGTRAWWNGATRAVYCSKCYGKTKEGQKAEEKKTC